MMFGFLPDWVNNFLPILILLAVVTIVIARLPKIDVGHTKAFRRRRVMNWLPLGLTYALLYMARYNLTVSKSAFESMEGTGGGSLMGNDAFGIIFGVGTIIYGFSFLINGPLTDRLGGRFSILTGAAGALTVNVLMGLATFSLISGGIGHEFIARHFVILFSIMYGANMYFQSFGAVAIVKVNASWFHVRERGVFGAIFGILISLGIYFAFDWGYLVLKSFGIAWVFLVPAILLAIFWLIDVFVVRNTPAEAGQKDFDTADASSGDEGPPLGAVKVFKLMLKNPIIMTIAGVEFCSGFLRQSIMQWYRTFAKQTNEILSLQDGFVNQNWGLLLCCAGILGGVVAGVISDHVFGSRRGPVAAWLYGVMLAGGIALVFVYQSPAVGFMVIGMSIAVIGVHGMLSGTASMDFGGRRNVGIAVGIIDGFVYLGTAVMSFTYAILLPKEQLNESGGIIGPATNPDNWLAWPIAMIPVAVIGLFLAIRVWHAYPQAKGKKA
jgi:MFS transporter, OPA family, glycerol-3-phosphate transporter